MWRGRIGTLAALALAWGLLPGLLRAQNYTGPPSATFGMPPGAVVGPASGCASCGASVPTSLGAKCCHFCCPRYHHCGEGPVKLCFGFKCAKPIACATEVPHWGHWQKCWTPWPYGPDWGHCVAPPPAAQVVLNPATHYDPRLSGVPGTFPVPQMQQPNGAPGAAEESPLPRASDGIRPGL
jgi:hypothetical protein